MNFTNLGLVLSAMIGLVSADCYSSGETWGGPSGAQAASAALNDVCNTMARTYAPGESKSVCINGPQGIRFDFNVHHVSAGDRTLGKDECINGLYKEIANCPKGGKTKYGNWQYTSDPNKGYC